MPKPIIVGVDPLAPDKSPVTLGAALAHLTGAPLVLVASYLHDTLTNAVSGGRVEQELREDAAAALEELAAGVEAERVIAGGFSASRVLHDLAVERDAGLLVVGSSRRGRLGRLAPGTTAERLLHGATCPVAVAPAGLSSDWSPRAIGVGFIDLDEGRNALSAAAVLARTSGATLEAVTAIEPLRTARTAAVPPYDAGTGSDTARGIAETALRRALESVGRDPAEGQVFFGEPVDALVGLSGRVDLVVCGSRGYGPIESVLMGGVSHGLLRDARCPVVVLPRGATTAIDQLTAARQSATS
jgi:nucleotide-binding universal stress UspA family protein